MTELAATTHVAPMRLAAGIVAFHPDADQLAALLRAVHSQVDRVCLFVNGGMDVSQIAAARAAAPNLVVHEAPANLGVGEALNILALDALLASATHLWLFDQDSTPAVNLATDLQAILHSLAPIHPTAALIAPRLVAPPETPAYKSPRLQMRPGVDVHQQAWPVQFAATSGSLIDLSAYRAIGPFRADFFIDGIDVEWGLRAWALGYSVWIAKQATMPHRIGAGIEKLAGGLSTPAQSQMRLFAYARNAAAIWRLPHPPLAWKLKQIAYLGVQITLLWARRGFSPRFAGAMLAAIQAGLTGKLGPPPGARGAIDWTPH